MKTPCKNCSRPGRAPLYHSPPMRDGVRDTKCRGCLLESARVHRSAIWRNPSGISRWRHIIAVQTPSALSPGTAVAVCGKARNKCRSTRGLLGGWHFVSRTPRCAGLPIFPAWCENQFLGGRASCPLYVMSGETPDPRGLKGSGGVLEIRRIYWQTPMRRKIPLGWQLSPPIFMMLCLGRG